MISNFKWPERSSCPPERPCFEPAGPGTGCAFEEDEEGVLHPLCTIPQVDTILDDCPLGCEHPGNARRASTEKGWYYVMTETGPRIVFTGTKPMTGFTVQLSCCL